MKFPPIFKPNKSGIENRHLASFAVMDIFAFSLFDILRRPVHSQAPASPIKLGLIHIHDEPTIPPNEEGIEAIIIHYVPFSQNFPDLLGGQAPEEFQGIFFLPGNQSFLELAFL